jgi:hypothetical protein
MRVRIETPQSCWFIKKLANLATITREWIALQSIRKLPFLQDLLTAKQGRKRAHALVIPEAMQETMKKSYNDSQVATHPPISSENDSTICSSLNPMQPTV